MLDLDPKIIPFHDDQRIHWTERNLASRLDAAIKLITDTYAPSLGDAGLTPLNFLDETFLDQFLDIFDS